MYFDANSPKSTCGPALATNCRLERRSLPVLAHLEQRCVGQALSALTLLLEALPEAHYVQCLRPLPCNLATYFHLLPYVEVHAPTRGRVCCSLTCMRAFASDTRVCWLHDCKLRLCCAASPWCAPRRCAKPLTDQVPSAAAAVQCNPVAYSGELARVVAAACCRNGCQLSHWRKGGTTSLAPLTWCGCWEEHPVWLRASSQVLELAPPETAGTDWEQASSVGIEHGSSLNTPLKEVSKQSAILPPIPDQSLRASRPDTFLFRKIMWAHQWSCYAIQVYDRHPAL